MKKFIATLIALTAIGVAVKANAKQFIKSSYKPMKNNVAVISDGKILLKGDIIEFK